MIERLNEDLKAAMRARDNVRRDTIRLLMTALHNREIERGESLTEQEIAAELQRQAKQRRDSIAAFEEGGRADLAEEETRQLEVIESYLPEQLGEAEIRARARALIAERGAEGPSGLGRVMGPLMGELRGRADGALVQRIVREELGL